MLYLVEHFYSIQGEGRFVGTPSLFLRFGGCNMKCEGFGCREPLLNGTTLLGCDTIYAVNREHFAQTWQKIETLESLVEIVQSYALSRSVDIVFTGGEPLLYMDDPLLVAFLEYLHKHGHKIHFETNGSLSVDFQRFPIYKEAIFALSVKLTNSGEDAKKRVKPSVLKSIFCNAKEAYFKFSIDANVIKVEEEEEIASIVAIAPSAYVYCMPLGSSKREIEDSSEALVEFCKQKGYNFGDRLHIRIWDKERGI